MTRTRLNTIPVPTSDGMCPVHLHNRSSAAASPGVLLLMDAPGIRPALHEIAARIAGEGYAVAMPDLFYRAGPYPPIDAAAVFSDPERRAAHRAPMKGAARPLLRRFGFRTVLTTIGVAAPLAYAVTAAFRPDWPISAIFATLLVGGFLTSLQFTAYNTIAYGDVEPARMSRATSFYATFQQLALSLGIAASASTLTFAMRWHGHARPAFDDFSLAILAVTGFSLLAVFANMRFARDAGAELSGHRTSGA